MEKRSIDLAQTASIDMMALNNKVVNMRQVVKRTKVHVISKLCKHINALKKKQGTEEQKAKNMRKAQRFIEEIDSMKKLKEDKVSKYALANTKSFADISKMSLLPGPRALARLADHPLMKKVVTDFRDQHADWPDLAAYLLIKQTGRRFKTKKQKQKKLARCIENMNASETMTKAYILGRFGQEGLAKAEQRFERKRKRQKSVVGGDRADSEHKNDGLQQNTEKVHSADSRTDDLIEDQEDQEKMSKNKTAHVKDAEIRIMENNKGSRVTDMVYTNTLIEGVPQMSNVVRNDSDNSHTERETVSRNECVVKELKLEAVDNILGGDGCDDSGSGSDKSSSQTSSDDDDIVDDSNDDENSDKHKKHKKTQIPKLLKRSNKTLMSDPFFAVSDDDENEDEIDSNTLNADANDDSNSDVDLGSSQGETESMFYIPAVHREQGASKGGFKRGATREIRGRRGASGGFQAGQRDMTFRGDYRGRTFRGRSQGRERNVAAYKITSHQDLEKRSSRGGQRSTLTHSRGGQRSTLTHSHGGQRSTGTYSRVHSSVGGQVADLQTSKTFPKTPATAPDKLHPSWEASKKRRAEQSGITAFQGSKLTFDDDDD
ncbi:hypothetical protein BsWGS_04918 [Bradybaena similaris]